MTVAWDDGRAYSHLVADKFFHQSNKGVSLGGLGGEQSDGSVGGGQTHILCNHVQDACWHP
jgi:hypothetical protein